MRATNRVPSLDVIMVGFDKSVLSVVYILVMVLDLWHIHQFYILLALYILLFWCYIFGMYISFISWLSCIYSCSGARSLAVMSY
jgi:hypothetical protein